MECTCIAPAHDHCAPKHHRPFVHLSNVIPPDHVLFGRSPAMSEVRMRAEKICDTNMPMLLCAAMAALAKKLWRGGFMRVPSTVRVNS